MHDGMQYMARSKVKVKVASPRKSEIRPFLNAIFSPIYNGGWQMTTDSFIMAQYLKLLRAGFLIFVLLFVSVISKLAVSRSRPSVPYGANFYY